MYNVKAVFERKFLSRPTVEIGFKNGVFRKKDVMVKFWLCNLKKAHPCAEPRLLSFDVYCVNVRGASGL